MIFEHVEAPLSLFSHARRKLSAGFVIQGSYTWVFFENKGLASKGLKHEIFREINLEFSYFLRLSPKSRIVERGTCIKGLIWPPLEPKTESCFSPMPSYWLIRRVAHV